MTRKRITAYVSELKHKELKTCCARLGVSMSKFIDSAVKNEVKKVLEDQKKLR